MRATTDLRAGHNQSTMSNSSHPDGTFSQIGSSTTHIVPEGDAIFLKEDEAGNFGTFKLDAPNSTLNFEKQLPSGPFVMTGPVIGMVTESCARILIEMNVKSQVTCFLTDSDGHQFAAKKTFEARRPDVFQFEGLAQSTYYKLTLNVPVPGLIKSGFRTIPSNWDISKRQANIAFVTSNDAKSAKEKISTKLDLWKDVCKQAMKGEIDYIIHMGDNVITDSDDLDGTKTEWDRAMRFVRHLPRQAWNTKLRQVCDIARGLYRKTWNHPPTKHALANAPNLMILGEHDIRDRWGDYLADSDPKSVEFFVGSCFYNVYNEFQRNLYEDYKTGKSAYDSAKSGQAHHFHVLGDIGFMMLDVTAARTFHKDHHMDALDTAPLLGLQQWRDIETALSPNGYYADCRMLFVVTPRAPCYIGEGPSSLLTRLSAQYTDMFRSWSTREHVPEASLLMSNLFDWRVQHPNHREVCLITGSTQILGNTEIVDLRYSAMGNPKIDRMKQITVSPIVSEPAKSSDDLAVEIIRGTTNSLGENHRFSKTSELNDVRSFVVVSTFAQKSHDGGYHKRKNKVQTYYSFKPFTAGEEHKKSLPVVSSNYRPFLLAGMRCLGHGPTPLHHLNSTKSSRFMSAAF